MKNRTKIAPWCLLAYYGILTVAGGWGLTYCLRDGDIYILFIHLSASHCAVPAEQEEENLFQPADISTDHGAALCSDSPFWQTDLGREPVRTNVLIDTGSQAPSEVILPTCVVADSDVLFPPPRAPVAPGLSDCISTTVLLI